MGGLQCHSRTAAKGDLASGKEIRSRGLARGKKYVTKGFRYVRETVAIGWDTVALDLLRGTTEAYEDTVEKIKKNGKSAAGAEPSPLQHNSR